MNGSDSEGDASGAYMGWLRLVGSFELQVYFAKRPYKRDDILQKRPIILRSLLVVATPYGHPVDALSCSVFLVCVCVCVCECVYLCVDGCVCWHPVDAFRCSIYI